MRDLLNKNTDPPSANYPYGEARDTNGLDGTWISSETWGDFIHTIHKMAHLVEEIPDNTIDKQTPTLSNTIHNQQLLDVIAEFTYYIVGNNYRTRLNETVLTDISTTFDIFLLDNETEERIDLTTGSNTSDLTLDSFV